MKFFPSITAFPEPKEVEVDLAPTGLDIVAKLKISTNVSDVMKAVSVGGPIVEMAEHFTKTLGRNVDPRVVLEARMLAAAWAGPAMEDGTMPGVDDFVRMSIAHGSAFVRLTRVLQDAEENAVEAMEDAAVENFPQGGSGTEDLSQSA